MVSCSQYALQNFVNSSISLLTYSKKRKFSFNTIQKALIEANYPLLTAPRPPPPYSDTPQQICDKGRF